MVNDETVEQLRELIYGPLQLVATEVKDLIAIYRQAESEARATARNAGTVAKMHAAELHAANAKGAGDALTAIVRVLDGATRKGR